MPTMAPIAKIAVKAFMVMASWKKMRWTSLFEGLLEYDPKTLKLRDGFGELNY